MYTLGINAVFHDSSACLIKDGVLIAAAEEERFTHIKHGKRPIPFSTYELPFHAIDYCLQVAGIHLNDVDHIAYSFNPNILLGEQYEQAEMISLPLKPSSTASMQQEVITLPMNPSVDEEMEQWTSPWDPLFLSAIVNAPGQLADGWPHHLQPRFIGAEKREERWHFVDHHLSHAASAFLCSPFKNAAVLTIDGRGEKATTAYYRGNGNSLELIQQVNMPHSLGLLYERVTTHLGFLHSSDEYKVMALASYGKPTFVNEFDAMIHVFDDGTYTIDDIDLETLFGPKRRKGDEFTAHHFNIAHSLQKVLQDKTLELVNWLYEQTGQQNLCIAGGVMPELRLARRYGSMQSYVKQIAVLFPWITYTGVPITPTSRSKNF